MGPIREVLEKYKNKFYRDKLVISVVKRCLQIGLSVQKVKTYEGVCVKN